MQSISIFQGFRMLNSTSTMKLLGKEIRNAPVYYFQRWSKRVFTFANQEWTESRFVQLPKYLKTYSVCYGSDHTKEIDIPRTRRSYVAVLKHYLADELRDIMDLLNEKETRF